jgi:hypothetical protein
LPDHTNPAVIHSEVSRLGQCNSAVILEYHCQVVKTRDPTLVDACYCLLQGVVTNDGKKPLPIKATGTPLPNFTSPRHPSLSPPSPPRTVTRAPLAHQGPPSRFEEHRSSPSNAARPRGTLPVHKERSLAPRNAAITAKTQVPSPLPAARKTAP